MDPILRQKITDRLTKFLNRAPKENEIVNGQNDATLMHWIAQDDAAAQTTQANQNKADIAALKAKVKI